MNDTHFNGMLEVARGIRKMEQNNPNAYGWYLVNAQAKFREDDQIEKMKRQQEMGKGEPKSKA